MGRFKGMLDAITAKNYRLDIVEMFTNKFWDSWLNFAQLCIILILSVLGKIQILNLHSRVFKLE